MRAALKIIVFSLWMPLMIAVATVAWLCKWVAGQRFMSMLTFKGANLFFNIRVTVKGELDPRRPLILISNHTSYLDILVLGSQLPIAFTPKKEISKWPVVGFCCRLGGCVFVDRRAKSIQAAQQEIYERLESGRAMCIFAEGTTNDGTNIKPFKSSLFTLAEGNDVQLQPVAITYTHRDGNPLDSEGRAQVAWYDDMTLLPHLWQVLGSRRIDVSIQLLSPIDKSPQDTRKDLCAKCEAVIVGALNQENA